MATMKKPAKKRRPAARGRTVKTTKPTKKAVVRKQVQKKKQAPKKTLKTKTRNVSGPAKKQVGKKIKGLVKKVKDRILKTKRKKTEPKQKRLSSAPRSKAQKVTKEAVQKLPVHASIHDSHRREILRRQLIQKREEIVREAKSEIAKYITGEANQLVETALDEGDWSVVDVSADINLRRLETHRQRLLGIDEALMKLREGSYGVCEDCGTEISAERLKVMPFAIYCRDCQEKREQLEKIEREEIIS
ncbi:MAG TPA: TraR/DksA C4-type zinc finger protein [Thermodesulfovibrionales bacterium]|nr:TraR/DksA C4-type zinc finger protein [Thermodesulfovibrionales bacterium]